MSKPVVLSFPHGKSVAATSFVQLGIAGVEMIVADIALGNGVDGLLGLDGLIR